jgi:hypothetical protein
VADNAGLPYPERIQQRQHISGVIGRAERPVRFIAIAKAAQIGGYEPIPLREAQHDRLPRQPEFRPAVKQQKRRPFAQFGYVQRGSIHPQRLMSHGPSCKLSAMLPL